MTKLSVKQQKFADKYIETGNATQSAIDAGYSKKTAAVIASENLTKPNIREYIDNRMKEAASKRIMSAQEALELLTRIANGEELETKVVGTPFGAESVKVPPDPKTKIAAVRELLKRYPTEDKLTEQKLRVLTAEADIKEAEALEAKQAADNTGEVMIVDDIPED